MITPVSCTMNALQKARQSTKLQPGVSTGLSLPCCCEKKAARYVGSKEFNFQIFHHDNDPAHSAHVTQAFLAKNNMPLVRQAPYYSMPLVRQAPYYSMPLVRQAPYYSMPLVRQAPYSPVLAPCDLWWSPNSERTAILITSGNYKKIDERVL